MSRTAGLASWLATLSPEQMHRMLQARPDVALPPRPSDVVALAGRLAGQHSIGQALERVSRPALQVAEALLALGGSADRDDLLTMLGATDPGTAARVDRALDELLALALAWPSGTAVRLGGAWRSVLPDPLALGRPGRELYALLTVAQLARIGATHGIEGLDRKDRWILAVTAAVADPTTIGSRLERAGPELAELVRRIAVQGPRVGGVHFPGPRDRVALHDLGAQLVVQGWVVPTQWGGAGEMPREVALAVRGPGYHAPFDTGPPSLGTAAVDPGGLERTGRHAASAALDAVRRLLALLDRDPPATLQAGGVGIRELRRAAKQLPATEAAVRLWLETAAGAGLLAPAGECVLSTTDADGWLASDPADALARLLLAWWRLPIVPGHRVDDAGKPVPALVRAFGGGEHRRLRADALAAIADVGPGRGIVETDSLAAVLAFQAPVAYGGPDLPARLRSTVAEAWPPTARSPRFGPTCSPPSTRPTPRPGWRMQRPACCPRPRAPPPSCPT